MSYTFVTKRSADEPLSYPVLMKSVGTSSPFLVLFTDRDIGMKLKSTGFNKAETGWYPADNPAHWERFEGTITVAA